MQLVQRSDGSFGRLVGRRAGAAFPEYRLEEAVHSPVLQRGCFAPAVEEGDRRRILPAAGALHTGLAEVALVGHPVYS
jgi:hypothetical protein